MIARIFNAVTGDSWLAPDVPDDVAVGDLSGDFYVVDVQFADMPEVSRPYIVIGLRPTRPQ